MRGIREDGRGHAADLVIGQRVVAAQCGEWEAKRDASCMVFLLTKRLLKKPHTGFLDSEPSLSAVRCGRHEEPGWPCCHRLS
jgi:hypothetical protein